MISKGGFEWDYQKEINLKIRLEWSKWFSWREIESRDVDIPTLSGVYEVRTSDLRNCFDIGKAMNLRSRVLRGLVLGKKAHSTGERMKKEGVNLDMLKVRWVKTKNPAALEEYLHNGHKKAFGHKPLYVRRT